MTYPRYVGAAQELASPSVRGPSSGPGRADREAFKNFPRALKAHLEDPDDAGRNLVWDRPIGQNGQRQGPGAGHALASPPTTLRNAYLFGDCRPAAWGGPRAALCRADMMQLHLDNLAQRRRGRPCRSARPGRWHTQQADVPTTSPIFPLRPS